MLCKRQAKQNKFSRFQVKNNELKLFYPMYLSVYIIWTHFFSCNFFFLTNQTERDRDRDRDRDIDIDLWISRRFWKSQGRMDQTQGQYQTEAYQATLTWIRSSASSPSTSDSVSPLSYRFYSPPVSAISDPYPPYLCVCVSLTLCVLTFALSVSLCSCVFF